VSQTHEIPGLEELDSHTFELGPIRPPSEAHSLLIRATRNCPWNRCEFCSVYKGETFELRPVEDVQRDIDTAKEIADGIKTLAWRIGFGESHRRVAALVHDSLPHNAAVRNVALWLYGGGASAFLQDANSIILSTRDLLRVVSHLKQTFPDLQRITSYGRSRNAAKKSSEEFAEIRAAGLSRIHIGLESGCDEVLDTVQKGCTADHHVKGGRAVVEAGIELSEYVMPGLGGRRWSESHVRETARVLNEIDPAFIRIRSFQAYEAMPMWQRIEHGGFELLREDEVVEEIGALIERLECSSVVKSDHMMNILMEVEGKLPEDKQKMLALVHRFTSLPEREKLDFMVGRRLGWYRSLDDLQVAARRDKVDQALRHFRAEGHEDFESILADLKIRVDRRFEPPFWVR
jgi:radical SAM superfamily enzyme YgiQ (UPF0313 family)